MLQAPTNEAKKQSEAARALPAPEVQRKLSPPFANADFLRLGGISGFVVPYSGIQRHQRFAGLQRTIGNQAVLRMLSHSAPAIQSKLTVNEPGDPYEQEADRMADQVMPMPDASLTSAPSVGSGIQDVQRKCSCSGSGSQCSECQEEEELKLQRSAAMPVPAGYAPPIVHEVIRSPGQPLDPATRAFFEPRFGYDFGHVRVHRDQQAAEANRSIYARAFTLGGHIAFAEREYAPATPRGRRLLAHELTHVLQQGQAQQAQHSPVVQRDIIEDLKKEAEKKAEALAKQLLAPLATAPVGPPSGYTGDPKCGPTYCQPFASTAGAVADLAWAGPLMLAGIAKKVNTRVVPLWASYLSGGSSPKNLTADFGKDFTLSPTTADATRFLVGELRKDIEANKTALLGGATTATIDFTPRLSAARAAIDDPSGPNQMNFDVPSDIAGNIAGGIGKDETTFKIGAQPSPFNDSRDAAIRATLTQNPDGSITVVPDITFTVKDTIDLCPGDCGTAAEQVATIPLSRFEATGLTGDVPLTVQFDAPASELGSFLIPPSAPPAPTSVAGTVTASVLNIRSSPSTSSAIVGGYPRGTAIDVLCQTTGTVVEGNNIWLKTDKGFVSGRYVTLSLGAIPAAC